MIATHVQVIKKLTQHVYTIPVITAASAWKQQLDYGKNNKLTALYLLKFNIFIIRLLFLHLANFNILHFIHLPPIYTTVVTFVHLSYIYITTHAVRNLCCRFSQ